MILHCWFCSLGGERLSETSKVAEIRDKDLHRPVDHTMFDKLPKAQFDPFRPNSGWRYMTHAACGKYPWPQEHVDPKEGPTKILTDQGMIDVFPMFVCDQCGREYKTQAALKGHITKEHGDNG